MKTLKNFLEVYEPRSEDEKKFKDKHVAIKHKDRNEVNGKANEDDVFNASNVKTVDRKANRQGYDVGEDEKVYEEVEELDELSRKTLGSYGSKALRAGLAGDRKRFKGANLASAKMYPDQYEKSPLKARVTANEDIDIESMNESELLDFALDLLEKTLTPAEMKKREEIAKAIERENPEMPMAQKMAIATAQAKKVAESSEEYGKSIDAEKRKNINRGDLDKISKISAMLKAEKKPVKEEAEQIDELSKNTLHSYIEKSARDVHNQAYNAGKKEGGEGKYDSGKILKSLTRQIGISDATRKLTGKAKVNANEEVEQIDELSKKTLATYAVKAKNQMGRDEARAGYQRGIRTMDGKGQGEMERAHDKRAEKRSKGIDTALNKLAMEETDLEETRVYPGDYHVTSEKSQFGGHRPKVVHKDKGHTMYLGQHAYKKPAMAIKHGEAYLTAYAARGDRAADNASIDFARANKKHLYVKEEVGDLEEKLSDEAKNVIRQTVKATGAKVRPLVKIAQMGKNTADEPMKNEEVEQIIELSNKTLSSYAKKATNQAFSKGVAGGAALSSTDKDTEAQGHKLVNKAAKRMMGAQKAIGKLTKEDIINRAVANYVPEQYKFTPVERLLNRLNGLSETHVDLVLNLFNSLNEYNQSIVLEQVQTAEGVNRLLDFAIQNRGE